MYIVLNTVVAIIMFLMGMLAGIKISEREYDELLDKAHQMNNDWYEHSRKINDNWLIKCNELHEELDSYKEKYGEL